MHFYIPFSRCCRPSAIKKSFEPFTRAWFDKVRFSEAPRANFTDKLCSLLRQRRIAGIASSSNIVLQETSSVNMLQINLIASAYTFLLESLHSLITAWISSRISIWRGYWYDSWTNTFRQGNLALSNFCFTFGIKFCSRMASIGKRILSWSIFCKYDSKHSSTTVKEYKSSVSINLTKLVINVSWFNFGKKRTDCCCNTLVKSQIASSGGLSLHSSVTMAS